MCLTRSQAQGVSTFHVMQLCEPSASPRLPRSQTPIQSPYSVPPLFFFSLSALLQPSRSFCSLAKSHFFFPPPKKTPFRESADHLSGNLKFFCAHKTPSNPSAPFNGNPRRQVYVKQADLWVTLFSKRHSTTTMKPTEAICNLLQGVMMAPTQ